MKKFLSIVTLLLVLVLLATAFVGCKKDDEEVPGNALQSARDYIYAMYKDKAENTPSDYQVVGVVTIDGATYTVTWSVNVAEDLVRVVP
ncbi:MAG: hypothetical protein ACI4SP_02100, partial [Eubacteriales bacterium]